MWAQFVYSHWCLYLRVSRKMLMVSVGNLSFFNGGGNFLTLPSGKANQTPRMKGLFAFQASFLTLPLISISVSLSYLQSPKPLFFWLHFTLIDTLYKAHLKNVWIGQFRQEGKAKALCFLFKGISWPQGTLLCCGCQRSCGKSLFSLPMMSSVISSILHAMAIGSGQFPFFSFYQLLDCICFPNHRVTDFIQPSCFYSLDRLASSPGSTTAQPTLKVLQR